MATDTLNTFQYSNRLKARIDTGLMRFPPDKPMAGFVVTCRVCHNTNPLAMTIEGDMLPNQLANLKVFETAEGARKALKCWNEQYPVTCHETLYGLEVTPANTYILTTLQWMMDMCTILRSPQ